jgi:formate dehydrogenase major subunit
VGSIVNDLTSISADPNVSMHEAKSYTLDVRPGRVSTTEALPLEPALWPTREKAPDTPKSGQPEGQVI